MKGKGRHLLVRAARVWKRRHRGKGCHQEAPIRPRLKGVGVVGMDRIARDPPRRNLPEKSPRLSLLPRLIRVERSL